MLKPSRVSAPLSVVNHASVVLTVHRRTFSRVSSLRRASLELFSTFRTASAPREVPLVSPLEPMLLAISGPRWRQFYPLWGSGGEPVVMTRDVIIAKLVLADRKRRYRCTRTAHRKAKLKALQTRGNSWNLADTTLRVMKLSRLRTAWRAF